MLNVYVFKWFNLTRLKISCSYRTHFTTWQSENLFDKNM